MGRALGVAWGWGGVAEDICVEEKEKEREAAVARAGAASGAARWRSRGWGRRRRGEVCSNTLAVKG